MTATRLKGKCLRCGGVEDVKQILINGAWTWICYGCYMADKSESYGFRLPDA